MNNQSGPYELMIKTAANLPMVKIDREKFLKRELIKYCTREQVNKAIENNPAYANINIDIINKIAKSSINYETNKVSLISFGAGLPGGFGMIATVPSDITQYFAHIIRILQKLIYLYGWEELFDDEGNMDDETANILTLFIGIMFGVNGAASTVTKLSASSAQKASKSIASKALTKGTIYPIVKKIARTLGVKITKETYAKGISKSIPIIGGFLSGGITYASYKPMANKLKRHLVTLKWANTEYYKE